MNGNWCKKQFINGNTNFNGWMNLSKSLVSQEVSSYTYMYRIHIPYHFPKIVQFFPDHFVGPLRPQELEAAATSSLKCCSHRPLWFWDSAYEKGHFFLTNQPGKRQCLPSFLIHSKIEKLKMWNLYNGEFFQELHLSVSSFQSCW